MTTGRWNRLPALERTTFGEVASTLPRNSTTASAPAASAARMMAPALPGSWASVSTTTSIAPDRAATRAPGPAASSMTTTASTPWESVLMAAMTRSLARWTYRPAARASSQMPLWRSRAASVRKTSRTLSAAYLTASRTPWGPSTRNLRYLARTFLRARPATRETRSDAGLVSTSRPAALGPASAGRTGRRRAGRAVSPRRGAAEASSEAAGLMGAVYERAMASYHDPRTSRWNHQRCSHNTARVSRRRPARRTCNRLCGSAMRYRDSLQNKELRRALVLPDLGNHMNIVSD